MKEWTSFISYDRFMGDVVSDVDSRSAFMRDYDRIIFSSAFRRLQNKTQVFPLPGNVFVHNRLTHSLEVASVGRSLGSIVGNRITQKYPSLNPDVADFFRYDLSGVVASACLAHDVGNPAFGHSGEKAISNYFKINAGVKTGDRILKDYFDDKDWADLINFEGNANALRLLTQTFRGKLPGGQRLTYLTLASIIKYPCDSSSTNKNIPIYKKYGHFQAEQEIFENIMNAFPLKSGNQYLRHPFVYLVEAADDICYRIIDMEDGHRIGILSTAEILESFIDLIQQLEVKSQSLERTHQTLKMLDNANEKVAYLRAKCINVLVNRAADNFLENADQIINGSYPTTLMDTVTQECSALREIERISIEKIYNHPSVIEVEIAGYHVMSEILSWFVTSVLSANPSPIEKKVLHLIPDQHANYKSGDHPYHKVMGILDFVSGMTDGYATELYRKIKGIEIPSHK